MSVALPGSWGQAWSSVASGASLPSCLNGFKEILYASKKYEKNEEPKKSFGCWFFLFCDSIAFQFSIRLYTRRKRKAC